MKKISLIVIFSLSILVNIYLPYTYFYKVEHDYEFENEYIQRALDNVDIDKKYHKEYFETYNNFVAYDQDVTCIIFYYTKTGTGNHEVSCFDYKDKYIGSLNYGIKEDDRINR